MIKEFVNIFDEYKCELESKFSEDHISDYKELVKNVVMFLGNHVTSYNKPDYTRIKEITWGDYQGTLVYVIGATGYQPSTHWTVKVDYGSCSGCDTLEGIRSMSKWSDKIPNTNQVKDYMLLALHIIQGLKEF